MPTLTTRQLHQQVREAHQELRALARAVSLALAQLDAVLRVPVTPARVQQLAAITHDLDEANDKALHFGLADTLAAIKREKQRLRDLVEKEIL